MEILRVISLLLNYPEADVFDAKDELTQLISQDNHLNAQNKQALLDFVENLMARDILDAQEDYVATFDKGRFTSMLLFEHIHGESRDRGQAMIDLIEKYREHGLELDAKELPDYLPLFLEFLSQLPAEESLELLNDVNHILALLAERLTQRDSDYATLFSCLLSLTDDVAERDEIARKVAAEIPDDTPEAIDKIWEEEAVTFGATDQTAGCTGPDYSNFNFDQLAANNQNGGTASQVQVPINWIEPDLHPKKQTSLNRQEQLLNGIGG